MAPRARAFSCRLDAYRPLGGPRLHPCDGCSGAVAARARSSSPGPVEIPSNDGERQLSSAHKRGATHPASKRRGAAERRGKEATAELSRSDQATCNRRTRRPTQIPRYASIGPAPGSATPALCRDRLPPAVFCPLPSEPGSARCHRAECGSSATRYTGRGGPASQPGLRSLLASRSGSSRLPRPTLPTLPDRSPPP